MGEQETYFHKLVTAILCLGSAAAFQMIPIAEAAETAAQYSEYTETGSWQLALAVGRGVLQSPLGDGQDLEVVAMPRVRYYGKRFYLEDTAVGYSLYETPSFAFDIAGRLNTDGFYFPRSGSELSRGFVLAGRLMGADEPAMKLEPPKRHLSYLGGFAAQWLGPVTIGLGAYRDVTDVHGGDEIPLSLSKQFALGSLLLGVELGATYQSRKLVDYYYGVEIPGPGTSSFPLYQPDAALNTHATLEAKYPLSSNLDMVLAGRIDWMDDAIANSPYVTDASPKAFFAGVQYSWK
ncbi:MipA/OmpV family protein [Microbulbifer sp. HZ11]|uniref:MipA/OmpV family protein n=1 Tax=unclassified Microbulbifer TaxID=2619833 RepID=UPI0005BDC7E0|nr:MipA/OmpV family protein [Microbulbifer sp. HZ11]